MSAVFEDLLGLDENPLPKNFYFEPLLKLPIGLSFRAFVLSSACERTDVCVHMYYIHMHTYAHLSIILHRF